MQRWTFPPCGTCPRCTSLAANKKKRTEKRVKGEKGDKEKKVKERSHVVTSGKMGKRKFKKTVKALGKKYGQDSVLTQTKKSGRLSATRKGGLGKEKGIGVGKFKPQGKNPEGQSQIKGKTFTYG